MKCNFVLALLLALLFGISPAAAQEPQPGDACPAEDRFMRVAGPENPGSGHFLYCDSGLTWQPVMRFLPNGDVLFNSAGTPAAPVHVWGEAIIGNQGLSCTTAAEGALRYTSSSDSWEFCNGSAWSSFGAGGTFTGLSDTPSAYTGAAGQFVRVNATPDALEFGMIALSDLPAIALNNLSDVTTTEPDGTVLQSFANPGSLSRDLAWDGANLWHADDGTNTIYKLDPSDGTVLDSFASPSGGPSGLAWDGTNLWHSDPSSDTIYKLNPSDGTVLDSFASPGGDPHGLAWDGTNLWNVDNGGFGNRKIYKLDPSDGSVITSFPSPGDSFPTGLTWDGTHLWHADLGTDTIYKLDPSDGSVITSFPSPEGAPFGLTWDGTHLWNADVGTNTIYKIGGTPPADGDVLTYNSAAGRWENQPAGAGGDNLGDHTATENLKLSGFWLSNDGGNEGAFVDTAGNVGIGTASPAAPLEVAGEIRFSSSGLTCGAAQEGAVRYTGGDPPWEYCDGAGWVNFKQPRCQDDDTGECYLQATRSNDDPDFVASNIVSGVNILGVTGILRGPGYTPLVVGTSARVSAGYDHVCIIQADDTLWCWGGNSDGQLGTGDTNPRNIPAQVPGSWLKVSAGGEYTCAIKTEETLWCWGDDEYGQLGDDAALADQHSPVQVSGGGSWKEISTAPALFTQHTCGIKTDETAWCWGDDGQGRLGDDITIADKPTPVQVADSGPWRSISAGGSFTHAIKTDDTLWWWGAAHPGAGGSRDEQVPFLLTESWKTVSAGYEHACGIKTDDTLWCWGRGDFGQLGYGGTSDVLYLDDSVRVEIPENGPWSDVSADRHLTCALKSDNTAWCWGRNVKGSVGSVETSDQLFPVRVGDIFFTSVDAGYFTSCGIRTGDVVACWGTNTADMPGRVVDVYDPAQIPDTTPNIFDFVDQTDVALNTIIESNIELITNIDQSVWTSIDGEFGNPEFRICNNSDCTDVDHAWGSTALRIDDGQYLQVRATSPGTSLNTWNFTVTVGGGSDTWALTTKDIIPDAFDFVNLTDVTEGTITYSSVLQITGITDFADVTISGSGSPQFQICGDLRKLGLA